MFRNLNPFGRTVGVIAGLSILSVSLIGCTTTSRNFESDWSGGAGPAVAIGDRVVSNGHDTGYGGQANIRRRISDHVKVEAQGSFGRFDGEDTINGIPVDGELDATAATLTGQYEFMPLKNQDVRLFVGGGGAHVWTHNEHFTAANTDFDVDIDNEFGTVAKAGIRVPWGFYLSVSRFFGIEPDFEASGGGVRVEGTAEDPDLWLFSAGFNVPF